MAVPRRMLNSVLLSRLAHKFDSFQYRQMQTPKANNKDRSTPLSRPDRKAKGKLHEFAKCHGRRFVLAKSVWFWVDGTWPERLEKAK